MDRRIESGKIFGTNFLTQIDLVEQNEQFFGVVGRQKGLFFGGERLGGIDEAEAQIGLRKGVMGAANAFLFDFARGIAQPGGIDELHRDSPAG